MGGGIVAGDGFAFCGAGSCLVWHASRVGDSRAISKGRMALFWRRLGAFRFCVFGFEFVMILESDARCTRVGT